MTCQELEPFLYPYLDGEFDAEGRLEVDEHLSQCGPCAQRVQTERLFRDALKARARPLAAAPGAPESLRRAVRLGLRQEQRRGFVARWARRGAAAAALLLIGSSLYLYRQPAHRQRYLEDAAYRHAMRLPMEIERPSAQEIEYWFRGKLAHRVTVPAFPNAMPAGGRVLNVQEKPAAYISYDAQTPGGKRPGSIGLLVFDDKQGDAPFRHDPEIGSSHGFNVVSWREEDIAYLLVTDLEEADIRRMISGPGFAPRRVSPTEKGPQLPVRPVSLQR